MSSMSPKPASEDSKDKINSSKTLAGADKKHKLRLLGSSIGKALYIKGDVVAKEDMLIDGRVEGSIALESNKLEIGANGRIISNAFARVVIINGELKGDVYATEQVILSKSGKILGNIFAPDVIIEDGAFLRGSIDMKKPEVQKTHSTSQLSVDHPTQIQQNQQPHSTFATNTPTVNNHDENNKRSFLDRVLEMTHFNSNHNEVNSKSTETKLQQDALKNAFKEPVSETPGSTFAFSDVKEKPEYYFGETSLIGATVLIKGEVVAEEDVLLHGQIDGVIYFKNNSLEVSQSAKIVANTFVKSMVSYGEIKGDIYASDRVLIKKTGQVIGKICAPRLDIESGSSLLGTIEMEPQNIEKIFSEIGLSGNKESVNLLRRTESEPAVNKIESHVNKQADVKLPPINPGLNKSEVATGAKQAN